MLPLISRYGFYYPVQILRGELPFRFLSLFRGLDQLSPEGLREYQLAQLNLLLAYVTRHVPFYRQNAQIRRIQTFADWSQLPVVTKQDIARNPTAFLSDERGLRVGRRSTSGTTAAPFEFTKDRLASSAMEGAMLSGYEWHGIHVGDRQARIWGTRFTPAERALEGMKDWVLNRRRLSAFRLSSDRCIRFFHELERFRPTYFYAYANSLYRFVSVLAAEGLRASALGVRAAICTGEKLYDRERRVIEEELGCPVVDEYGTTENGVIALQCRLGALHVMSQTVYVEILRQDETPAAEGEEGEVIVTELYSRSMPFIRYRSGDRAVATGTSCRCGRPMPVLRGVVGRIGGFIVRPDGQHVDEGVLGYALKDFALQFRAVQRSTTCLVIDVVPRPGEVPGGEHRVRAKLREYLGDGVEVNFAYANRLDADPSGKFRYFRREF